MCVKTLLPSRRYSASFILLVGLAPFMAGDCGRLSAAEEKAAPAKQELKVDEIKTSKGPLKISFIGHGTLMFQFGGKVIHVDPYSPLADYAKLPKADLILLTHEHRDHLDLEALKPIRQESTTVVLTEACAEKVDGGVVMKNGDKKKVQGFEIEAVPAYNIKHKRSNGEAYHPQGRGNGYIITFGDKRVYVAGDTEDTPELKALKEIEVAFLPMNLPYTMTPEMAAAAAKAFKPRILYPYHYGETKPEKLQELLKDVKGMDVRIRPMK